jgi:hypothetical protein
MKFNSSARFNRKAFNSDKYFDAGIHDAGTVNVVLGGTVTEQVTNGGFETGDLTGWTAIETGDGSVDVQGVTVHTGSYAVALSNNVEGLAGIKQTIDLTDVSELTLYYNKPHAGAPSPIFTIDGDSIGYVFAQTTGFEQAVIDLSEYSFTGDCEIYIKIEVTPA